MEAVVEPTAAMSQPSPRRIGFAPDIVDAPHATPPPRRRQPPPPVPPASCDTPTHDKTNVSELSLPPLPPLTLQHFSFSCPGLTGKDARTDIRMRDVGEVLACGKPIVIPLFQRKYCWEPEQAHRWFRDTLKANPNAGVNGKHGIGKVTFKDGGDVIWCVDGQQRTTTTNLMLAAVRDACQRRLTSCVKSDNSHQKIANLNAVVAQIDEKLFLDATAAHQWARDAAAHIVAATNECGTETEGPDSATTRLTGAFHAYLEAQARNYEAVPGCRLVPSLCDRRPFNELVMGGIIAEYCRQLGAAPVSDSRFPVSAAIATSAMGVMKCIFDSKIDELLLLSTAATTDERTAANDDGIIDAAQLEMLVRRSLSNMYVIYVDVLNPVNLAQVFLWMQEKTLFGMGALLYNAAPGKVFHAADLARNLFLAPFMNEGLEEQELLYRELWLEPFEKRIPHDDAPQLLDRMDAVIAQYIKLRAPSHPQLVFRRNDADTIDHSGGGPHYDHHTPKSARYVSAFEKQVHGMVDRMKAADVMKHDSSGMATYAALYSAYEAACATWRLEHREDDRSPQSPWAEAEAAGARLILQELSIVASSMIF